MWKHISIQSLIQIIILLILYLIAPEFVKEGEKVEKGAYISVRLLGSASKSACQMSTKNICDILSSELGLDGSKIYVTYHPVDLWGWNGSMF